MPVEFSKYAVLLAIERYSKSPPTPTDFEHAAHWWNGPFGQRIRNEVMLHLQNLKEEIKRMPIAPR